MKRADLVLKLGEVDNIPNDNQEIRVGMSEAGGDEPGYVETFAISRVTLDDGVIFIEVELGEPFFLAL